MSASALTAAERARGVVSNDDLPWNRRDHALYVGYAPFDKPRYAVAVVLEHGVSGSGLASPIARDLLAHALKYDTGAKKPFVPQSRDVAAADTKAKPT